MVRVTALETGTAKAGRRDGAPNLCLSLSSGTSKWNKIEHRLFSFITINWRGRPLRTYETVVNLIGNTTTRMGLIVRAALDRGSYPTGKRVSEKDMRLLNLKRDPFHGDWNYSLLPRALDK